MLPRYIVVCHGQTSRCRMQIVQNPHSGHSDNNSLLPRSHMFAEILEKWRKSGSGQIITKGVVCVCVCDTLWRGCGQTVCLQWQVLLLYLCVQWTRSKRPSRRGKNVIHGSNLQHYILGWSAQLQMLMGAARRQLYYGHSRSEHYSVAVLWSYGHWAHGHCGYM